MNEEITGQVSATPNVDFGWSTQNDAYSQSFGPMPNGTCYSDPVGVKSMAGQDLRPGLHAAYERGKALIEGKAHMTTAGGAGTAGYAMVPIYVDPVIIDRTRKWTPIVELMPRVSNLGITADYNVITAKGGGFTAAEDAALTEKNDTEDRASTSIKYLYAVGRVTGQMTAAQPSYMLAGFTPAGGAVGGFNDAAAPGADQYEILKKTRSIRELEENLIVNGNATTSGITGNPNGTEFDGIITIQSTTNKVDKNTTALSLDDINTAVQYAFDDGGRPNIAICSSAVYTDLLNLLSEKVGYMNPAKEVFWGFSTIVLHTMVGDIPVIPSMFMSNTTGSKAIYFLDLGVWEMRVLQDLSMWRFGINNDSNKFGLKIYECLICRAPAFNAWIGEIA